MFCPLMYLQRFASLTIETSATAGLPVRETVDHRFFMNSVALGQGMVDSLDSWYCTTQFVHAKSQQCI